MDQEQIKISAYRGDEEPSRITRLEKLAAELPTLPILALHDHKGCLSVNWSEAPRTDQLSAVVDQWRSHAEFNSNHYVLGEPLIGDEGASNPFGGLDEF